MVLKVFMSLIINYSETETLLLQFAVLFYQFGNTGNHNCLMLWFDIIVRVFQFSTFFGIILNKNDEIKEETKTIIIR